jgi:hypothetical protein
MLMWRLMVLLPPSFVNSVSVRMQLLVVMLATLARSLRLM